MVVVGKSTRLALILALPLALAGAHDGTLASAAGTAQDTPSAEQTPAPHEARTKGGCNVGPYVVYFEFANAQLSDSIKSLLSYVAKSYENCDKAQVVLTGHTDQSGSPSYNLRLAKRRTASVRKYLIEDGIEPDRIVMRAIGEAQPRVEGEDDARNVKNRRVEITFGPVSQLAQGR